MKRTAAVIGLAMLALTLVSMQTARATDGGGDYWLGSKTGIAAWGDPRFDFEMAGRTALAWGEGNVQKFYSYARFEVEGSVAPIVLYDLEFHEKAGIVPRREERHPKDYMRSFVALAHERGKQVILAPGKSLTIVRRADCVKRENETSAHAFIRCRIPTVRSDWLMLQAQNLECDSTTFSRFVFRAASMVRARLMVELTVLFHDDPCVTARRITHAWRSVKDMSAVEGFSLWCARRNGARPWSEQVDLAKRALALMV